MHRLTPALGGRGPEEARGDRMRTALTLHVGQRVGRIDRLRKRSRLDKRLDRFANQCFRRIMLAAVERDATERLPRSGGDGCVADRTAMRRLSRTNVSARSSMRARMAMVPRT